jgi:hypothetical protein
MGTSFPAILSRQIGLAFTTSSLAAPSPHAIIEPVGPQVTGMHRRVVMLSTLPAWAQRVVFAVIGMVSRVGFPLRRSRIPEIGGSGYLSAVTRVPAVAVPRIEVGDESYLYPPDTVHVTVAWLDRATVDIDTAMEVLQMQQLEAPRVLIRGLGCSADSLYLWCEHDWHFQYLRRAVYRAFGVRRRGPRRRLRDTLSYARVVRFEGRGWWPGPAPGDVDVTVMSIEIVRTDRMLSDEGTTVLAKLPLV